MPLNFEPHSAPTPPPPPSNGPSAPPPVPNPLRQDHSMPFGEQQTVDPNNLPKNAGNNLFQSDNQNHTNLDYDFIMNTPHDKRQSGISSLKFSLPGNLWAKVALGFGALIVVIIMFSLIGSVLKGPSNVTYFESVLQDQQELVHISSNASSETDISSNNQNFVATAGLALASNSTQLQAYLAANGVKFSPSVLGLKISKVTDNELSSAETAGNFNSTFSQVAGGELNSYLIDLRTAYFKTSGPHGRALLASFINQANLLVASLSNGS